jgi:DNA polymerase III subunit alpha
LRKEKILLGFFLTGHPMDDYKHVLQRLSCVPLRRLDQMDHDAVFRSAFIVEAVQIRIAAKSQKKFAILTISDGIERQELPIWADLYEEKNQLLRENQLLYAVLQVDKKGEELRLSCRWLDDLTKADESMIEACDRAFDKAKHHIARMQAKPAAPKMQESADKSKPSTRKEQTLMKPVSIKLDANRTRLSHILQLKQIFLQHQGTHPIQIHFHTSSKSLATLHIEGQGGITLSDQFKQRVGEMSCVLAIE